MYLDPKVSDLWGNLLWMYFSSLSSLAATTHRKNIGTTWEQDYHYASVKGYIQVQALEHFGSRIISFEHGFFSRGHVSFLVGTFPKTNIAPENRPCKKETRIPTMHFRVLC